MQVIGGHKYFQNLHTLLAESHQYNRNMEIYVGLLYGRTIVEKQSIALERSIQHPKYSTKYCAGLQATDSEEEEISSMLAKQITAEVHSKCAAS